ncbi:MAG: hypothetical protein FRX48_03987 [Lasallia pustulata]|uniref:Uncharacterized protein n=1 Tax=Lasallia pustulata TaxID=136370 RepID=A0A5M8PQV1_9LECA|nr:MAG: hypothetical protein FRX48_03987 [Lasallia pustulata]
MLKEYGATLCQASQGLRLFPIPLSDTNPAINTLDLDMLAARDQENLVHGHQAAAAAKPLNQGVKQLAPKTPGNKVPKTPFKVPLNDENGPAGFGGGKTVLKMGARGNENLMTVGKKGGLGDKNAFVTPLGPRNRAPLGLKTTNARAKAFQTPGPPIPENDLDKGAQRSATARKPKARVSLAEMTKVEILGDKDELADREIEYMPPRSIDLPDYPDDMPHDIDLSMFANGGLTRGFWAHYGNPLGDDGLTHHEREALKRQARWNKMDKEIEEAIQSQLDSIIPCTHDPSCPGSECKDATAHRQTVEAKQRKKNPPTSLKPGPPIKKPLATNPPSTTLTAKSAAAALSHPNRLAPTLPKNRKPSLPDSSHPFPPRNPTAAALASRTIGYSAGRATSASLRHSVLPSSTKAPSSSFPTTKANNNINRPQSPDTTLPPALYIRRYGVPPEGSEKWLECWRSGCFDEVGEEGDGGLSGGMEGLERVLREEEEEREGEFVW